MNSIPIRNVNPTPELMTKIRRAKDAIAEQKPREVRCPFCRHRLAKIFEDTRGHLETKCAKCGKVVLVDLVNTRKTRTTITF